VSPVTATKGKKNGENSNVRTVAKKNFRPEKLIWGRGK